MAGAIAALGAGGNRLYSEESGGREHLEDAGPHSGSDAVLAVVRMAKHPCNRCTSALNNECPEALPQV